MKELIFITQSDVVDSNNNYLKNILGASNKEGGYIEGPLWYDCDHVKLTGEDGRGDCMFVKVENKTKIYIVTYDDYDEDFEDVVKWWIDGSEDKLKIDQNWDCWDQVKIGLAYRGGRGYYYSLYAKEMI